MEVQKVKFISLSVIGVLFGFVQAGSFHSWKAFVLSIIGSSVAFGLAMGITQWGIDDFVRDSRQSIEEAQLRFGNGEMRWKYYILCVCILYTATAICVGIASSAREPGDEEESTRRVVTEYIPELPYQQQRDMHISTFVALLVPSLIGVRVALGEKWDKKKLNEEHIRRGIEKARSRLEQAE